MGSCVLAHLSSPQVKAKGPGHQKEQREGNKNENEEEMASFNVTGESPSTLGTCEESTGSDLGLEGEKIATLSSNTDTMRPESLRDLSRIIQLISDRNRSGLESWKSGP